MDSEAMIDRKQDEDRLDLTWLEADHAPRNRSQNPIRVFSTEPMGQRPRKGPFRPKVRRTDGEWFTKSPYFKDKCDFEEEKTRPKSKPGTASANHRRSFIDGKRNLENPGEAGEGKPTEGVEGMKKELRKMYVENEKLKAEVMSLNVKILELVKNLASLEAKHQDEVENRWKPMLNLSQQQSQDMRSRVLKHKEKISKLKKILNDLKLKYNEALMERDKLKIEKMNLKERHLIGFQADLDRTVPRSTSELFSLIWQGLLGDKTLDFRYIKRDFLQIIKGKTREELEDLLDGYELGLTRRELLKVLAPFTTDKGVHPHRLIDSLFQFQPYHLYEDTESEIHRFRMHFANRNQSKSSLERALLETISGNCSETRLIQALTNERNCLEPAIASPVVKFLLKGEGSIETAKLSLGLIEDWELLTDIVARLRYSLALKEIRTMDAGKILPVPCTASNLRLYLTSQMKLSEDQASILTFRLFPYGKREISAADFVTFLVPWKTRKELDLDGQLQALANDMTPEQLYPIGQRVAAVTDDYISLSQFLSEWEREFHKTLTDDQRYAVELFSFEETQTINALHFRNFMLKLCKIIESNISIPSARPPVEFDD